MPAPNAALMKQMARMFFIARFVRLPTDWKGPPDAKHFQQSVSPSQLIVPPNSPMNLFREASLYELHVDAAGKIGKEYGSFIDGTCDAICNAIQMWMLMASINARVMAITAIGPPGCVMAPPIKGNIMMLAPKKSPMELKYSNAISTAFSNAWTQWQSGLTIPGLPWYPAFAAFPGPMAPPMPNIPMPLITLPSSGEVALVPSTLSQSMKSALGDPTAYHHAELFDAIAQAFAIVFLMFKLQTQVMLVMGMGPIPTFAPPYVPVGPVVGGSTLPIPGCFV